MYVRWKRPRGKQSGQITQSSKSALARFSGRYFQLLSPVALEHESMQLSLVLTADGARIGVGATAGACLVTREPERKQVEQHMHALELSLVCSCLRQPQSHIDRPGGLSGPQHRTIPLCARSSAHSAEWCLSHVVAITTSAVATQAKGLKMMVYTHLTLRYGYASLTITMSRLIVGKLISLDASTSGIRDKFMSTIEYVSAQLRKNIKVGTRLPLLAD